MGLQNKKTDSHGAICLGQKRMCTVEEFTNLNDIIIAFSHFFTVDGNHIVMQPITGGRNMIANGTLGYFRFMMRKLKVHTAPMNVELLTQVFGTHRRALNVPAGKAFSPRTLPSHY